MIKGGSRVGSKSGGPQAERADPAVIHNEQNRHRCCLTEIAAFPGKQTTRKLNAEVGS